MVRKFVSMSVSDTSNPFSAIISMLWQYQRLPMTSECMSVGVSYIIWKQHNATRNEINVWSAEWIVVIGRKTPECWMLGFPRAGSGTKQLLLWFLKWERDATLSAECFTFSSEQNQNQPIDEPSASWSWFDSSENNDPLS